MRNCLLYLFWNEEACLLGCCIPALLHEGSVSISMQGVGGIRTYSPDVLTLLKAKRIYGCMIVMYISILRTVLESVAIDLGTSW